MSTTITYPLLATAFVILTNALTPSLLTDTDLSDTNVLQSDANVLQSDANVLQSDADVLQSDANVLQSDADVLQSDANVLQSDANVLQSDANVLQSDNAIDSHINPLDYLFNHTSEFNEIYQMFGSLLTSRSNDEFNLHNSNLSLSPTNNEDSLSTSFLPPQICVTSKDELIKIWNEMNTNDNMFRLNSIILTQTANCSMLEKIKTAILIMKHNFDEMMQNEISSVQYKELKMNYEIKLRKLQHQLDDTLRVASLNEIMEIEEMKNELTIQKNQINAIIRKMESERRILNDAYIRLCIADLEREHVISAVEVYKNITDKLQIRRIIYAAYANKEQNFKTILEFVGQTTDMESLLLGYSSLFELMKTNQHMNVMNLLLLTNAVIKHNDVDEFQKLLISLNDAVNVMHEQSDYEPFYNFMHSKNSSLDSAEGMIETFVKGAYNGHAANIGKILNMTKNFNIIRHRLYLMNSLINEMKLHGHSSRKEIFMVVYNVIQITLATYIQTNDEDKKLVNIVEQNLPDNVRDLMFTNLCIQNAKNNEYLYAGPVADESRRNIFTSRTKKIDDTFDFEIEFIDNGNKFLIKNSHYREHLFISDYGSPRKLLSWMPSYLRENVEAHFVLEIVDETFFRIKSEYYNEYLYSPSNETNNSDSRRTYFRPEEKVYSESTWKIHTCRHRVRYE